MLRISTQDPARIEKAERERERGHLGQCLSSLQGSYPGYNLRSTPPTQPATAPLRRDSVEPSPLPHIRILE